MILAQRAMGHRLNVRSSLSSHGFGIRERWILTCVLVSCQRRKLIGFVGPPCALFANRVYAFIAWMIPMSGGKRGCGSNAALMGQSLIVI
jgi:hypothetical protein